MLTAPYITDHVLLAALERVNTIAPAEAAALQKRLGRSQPELTAFILAGTLELRPDAAGVGLFAMLVLYEAFRSACVKVHKVRARWVDRTWKTVQVEAQDLRDVVDDPLDTLSRLRATSEPVVLRYVIEALTEVSEHDSVTITDEEFWQLYVVLKTAIETLHDVSTVARTV